jgi:hypothetical protein
MTQLEGGAFPEITLFDTLFHVYHIPSLHKTNTRYLLFENWDKRNKGEYYKDTLVPFTTAATSDTVYLTINY